MLHLYELRKILFTIGPKIDLLVADMPTLDQRIHRKSIGLCRALTAVVLFGLCATAGKAASINYGDFGPVAPGIRFRGVTESSGTDAVPLFGPPTPFSVGLDFNPMSFVAFGGGGSSDLTDGQLNLGIEGNPLVGISSVSLFEAGDFTLFGSGTAASQVFAGANMRITVTQIDGVDVAPIILLPSNASVAFNLVANPGIVQPWSLGLSLDVSGQLTAMGIEFAAGATKLEVVIDNQLGALSQQSSIAAIAKKDFRIDVTPTVVPEPGTAALFFSAGIAGLFFLRRAKR
jgi:hypothetical protein